MIIAKYPVKLNTIRTDVARSVVKSAGGGGGDWPWMPTSLANLRQYALDGGNAYESSTLDDVHYLRSLESYGTYRAPRQGRCWLFDGSDDFATRGARLTSGSVTALTVTARIKTTQATAAEIVSEYQTSDNSRQWIIGLSDGKLRVIISADGLFGANVKNYLSATSVNTGEFVDVAFTFDNGTLRLFVNGGEESTTKTTDGAVPSIFNGTAHLAVGAINPQSGTTNYFSGRVHDIRVYNVAKTLAQIQSIHAGDYDAPDEDGLLAHYPCNEEIEPGSGGSNTTGFDIGPNANHLTLTNITQSTFFATDTEITRNRNNSDGYRLSSGVYIPKRLSDNLAADGNALTVTGQAPYPARVDTPCVTNAGGTVYLAAAHLTGSETVVSWEGSTTEPTISAGRIDWDSETTLASLVLSDGTHYTCQEGPGSSNTNRTIYDIGVGGNDATITNGTVANIWANRLAGTVKDHCIQYGGGIAANGAFVPGIPSSANDAAGNAKTLSAGKFGNPYSRINFNPFTAAELNSLGLETAYAESTARQSVSPTDTKFRRTTASGDDRFFATDAALSGADLTNAEGYVS